MEDDSLDRADWRHRAPELGDLREHDPGRGPSVVVMELAPDLADPDARGWSELRRLWCALPPQSSILHAVANDGSRLLLRYAALDWSRRSPADVASPGNARLLATWGIRLTRLFEYLSVCVPSRELAWLSRPIVYFDLAGQIRLGFLPVSPSTSGEGPSELVARWPTCDDRALVFVVGRLLSRLWSGRDDQVDTLLGRCLALNPRQRFQSLRELRVALVLAGGSDPPDPGLAPQRAWHQVELGLGWLAIGRPELAREHFESALQLDPRSRLAQHGLARATAAIAGESPAEESGVIVDRAYADAIPIARALELENQRLFAEALEIYQWHAYARSRADHFTSVARCYLGLGDLGQAIDFAQRALEAAPARAEVLELLVDACGRAKLVLDALKWSDQLLAIAPDRGATHYKRGRCLLALGRFVEAKACFDRACALDPRLVEAMLLRREVARHLGILHAHIGTQGPLQLDVPAHLGDVRAAYVTGRLHDAIELLQDPAHAGDAIAQLLLAELLFHERRFEEAAISFDRAGCLSEPRRQVAMIGKARALLELDRGEEALRLLDRACAERPGARDAIEARARALAQLGRTDEAERELRRVTDGRSDLRVRAVRR